MRVAERRTKTRGRQVGPASPPPNGEAPSPHRSVEAAFDAIVPNTSPNDETPEVVRRNRRERAKRRLLDALDARGPYPLNESLRSEMGQLISRWAGKGFIDAFPEADEFEFRCVAERAILDAAAQGEDHERFVATERAYLRDVERKHGKVEIRGLQLSARVYQDLELAYVPLYVETNTPEPPQNARKNENNEDSAEHAMAEMVRRLARPRIPAPRAMSMHARLLLVGAPGSGKSTLLAYLATRAAQGHLGTDAELPTNPIPFIVPVRSLHSVPTNLEHLAIAAGVDAWFFERALRNTSTCLFIDGLDEARPEIANKLLDTIESILQQFPKTRVLVTSRPAGIPGGELPAPDIYARAELLPMTRDDVTRFIKQWCLAAELSLSKARNEAEHDARIAADDLMERVRASRAIEKLAQTPLLCSVICIVHRFLGQRIPERRVVLYDAITNALLYEWDHAKFPEGSATGKLDAHAKRSLLARLARDMHEAHEAEIAADDLIAKFARQLPHLGHSADDAARIVAEIRDRNGVLVERSPGQFAFSHLTFQEYLAAFHIVNERDFGLLVRKYRQKWWHEVIVLAAGFPGSNAQLLVERLLRKDGDGVSIGTMLAAQCVETAIELPAELRNEVQTRVAKLIPPRTLEDFRALDEIRDVAAPVMLQALKKADANGKASLLMLLGAAMYEPAIDAIGRALSDSTPIGIGVPITTRVLSTRNLSVAGIAVIAASDLLFASERVYHDLLQAMGTSVPEVRLLLAELFLPKKFPDPEHRIQGLIDEYDRTHPKAAAPSPRPKRAARSG